LRSAENNSFTAGAIYFESTSGPQQQIEDDYNLTSESQIGKLFTERIRPFKDIYQVEKGITLT